MRRIACLAVWAVLVAPTCHAQAVVIGAGYSAPRPIDVSPGQLITVFVRVPGKITAEPITAAAPLPHTLGGFSLLLRQSFSDPQQVPILSVSDAQSCSNLAPTQCDTVSMVTVQIPFELTPNVPRTTVPENFARLEIDYNGIAASSLLINPVPDRIHVLNSCDVAAGYPPGACLPVVTRPDGTLVARDNPAKVGEELTVALVGLGWAASDVSTGAATPGVGPLVDSVSMILDTRVNESPDMPDAKTATPVQTARLKPGSVGIYELRFTVPELPAGATGCSSSIRSNLTVSIGRTTSFDGVAICVEAR
jgi:uncharacterized protein (TIGR03437 family)